MRPAEPTNPSRAPRTPPRTHISPTPYHDPSIKYAPARRPHDSWQPTYAPTTPYTQFASPTIVLLPLNFRLVFGNDDFSKMHSAMDGFWSAIWVGNLPCDTLTRSQHFIPEPPLVSLQRHGLFVAHRSHVAPRYHRDGWRKSPYILS
jgi:hypothetical protein